MKFISIVLKLSVASLVAIVIANLVYWRGKTISDQVKTQMSAVEHSKIVDQAKQWARQLTDDARKGAPRQDHSRKYRSEEIPVSEQQKLRALIRDLNGSQKVTQKIR